VGIIIIKKRVLAWIVFFIFLIVLLNSKYFLRVFYPIHYREEINKYAEEYQVDPLLVASIIRVESKFNERAKSSKGAVGLMQLMPSTAKWVAPQVGIDNFEPSMLYDPSTNIKIGTWYLSSLKKEFPERLNVAIASYNAGRGRVRQWLEFEVWDGKEENLSKIPYSETRNFVGKVLYYYRIYKKIY